MRPEHAQYLVDPITKEPLQLQVFEQQGSHVITGLLSSPSNKYVISEGIPRLLPAGALGPNQAFATHQQKTAASFDYEWNNIYEENDYERDNFFHFLSPFIKAADLKDKKLLDVGCGSGRFTKHAALSNAELVVATDVGQSVTAAFALTSHLTNVCIVQADVYHMPVYQFSDLTFSIGVLHHLPQPEAGFNHLPDTVRPGGQVMIWVYNRRHNFRAVYIFESIRRVTKHLPKFLLTKLCYAPASIVHLINYLTHYLNWLRLPTLAKRVPFSYYANFPFSMKLSDAFDVLATPHSNYYYVEEVERWFRSSKLHSVKSYEHPEAGITCIGLLKQPRHELDHVGQVHHVAVAHNLSR